jgi:hypothetical protein
MKRFKSFNQALNYLNKNFGSVWINHDVDFQFYINNIWCEANHGFRMDPNTDEEYELFHNCCSDKVAEEINLRLT